MDSLGGTTGGRSTGLVSGCWNVAAVRRTRPTAGAAAVEESCSAEDDDDDDSVVVVVVVVV